MQGDLNPRCSAERLMHCQMLTTLQNTRTTEGTGAYLFMPLLANNLVQDVQVIQVFLLHRSHPCSCFGWWSQNYCSGCLWYIRNGYGCTWWCEQNGNGSLLTDNMLKWSGNDPGLILNPGSYKLWITTCLWENRLLEVQVKTSFNCPIC